jgi:protein-disulfide isomerase
MTSDLVARLREGGCCDYCDQVSAEAADAIERLRAERDALRALLAEYPVGGPMSADQAEWLRKVREALREGTK